MSKAELVEIHFDLPPQQPRGKNRVSYIEVLQSDGTKRKLTFGEPLTNVRTIRDESYVLQNYEPPKPSSWTKAVQGLLRIFGSHPPGNYTEILARSQVSCFDTRTGQLESRKLEMFPVTPNQIGFIEDVEFNAKGQLFKHLLLCHRDDQLRYSRRELYDWETGFPKQIEGYYPIASRESIDYLGRVRRCNYISEQPWTAIGADRYLDMNSGLIMVSTQSLKAA